MERKSLEWGLVGLIGLLFLIVAYYARPLFFLGFIGGPLIFISLFYGYKDRKRVLT